MHQKSWMQHCNVKCLTNSIKLQRVWGNIYTIENKLCNVKTHFIAKASPVFRSPEVLNLFNGKPPNFTSTCKLIYMNIFHFQCSNIDRQTDREEQKMFDRQIFLFLLNNTMLDFQKKDPTCHHYISINYATLNWIDNSYLGCRKNKFYSLFRTQINWLKKNNYVYEAWMLL